MQKHQEFMAILFRYTCIRYFTENNLTDSFNFKVKITDQTGNDGTKNMEIMVPLKYLSNFWRTLEMSFINCEVNLILT